MAMINCKECGKEISTEAKACPHCGAKVPRTKWWLWIPLGLIAAFLVFGAIVGGSPEAQEKGRERDAIALCWQDHERKSLDPSTKRFVASACEMMEQRFTTKHGHKP